MKQFSFTLLIIFYSTVNFAQNKLPAFGVIEKSDLEMKDCEFDKGSEAVKLIDWGNMYYDRGTEGISLFKTIYERRIRIKILNEKGLKYANVSIPYFDHNSDEKILKIDAVTYNLDETGNVISSSVDKPSFYNKRLNKNYSQLSFAFPNVKIGSVIEYKYKLERERMGQIKSWYFQDKIPTVYSSYTIKIPSIFIFDIQPTVVDSIDVKQSEDKELINVGSNVLDINVLTKNFVMRNLPGIRKYAYMGAVSDYLQRLEFQLKQIDYGDNNIKDVRTTWDDVVKELLNDEDFGKLLNHSLDELQPLLKELKLVTTQQEKVNRLLQYFKTTFTWNGDDGIYAYGGWKKLWIDKKGNTGDINLAFVNALNQLDIKAVPLLVSSRENGLVNSFFPFTNQFDQVLTYIPNGDTYLVIDASSRSQLPTLFPIDIVNTRAFLVTVPKGRMIDLIDDKNDYDVFVATKAEINKEGKMTGESIVNYTEYGKMDMLSHLQENKTSYLQNNFTKPYPTITIDSIAINNKNSSTEPLEHKIKFSSNTTSSGNYSFFNINLFSGLYANPFLDETRYADIDFGYKQTYTIFGNFMIPDGYMYDELPKNFLLQLPDGTASYSCTYMAEDNLLNVKIDISFKQTFYEVAVYPSFKEFYQKMLDKLNEPIVYKKK